MRTLLQDVRYGARMLWQSPGFTITSAISLALGIGATTAIFSIVYAVLLRPLPYRQPQELIRIYTEFPKFPNGGLQRFWMSAPEFLDLRRYTHSWASLDAWVNGGANLSGGKEPVRITASYVSGGLLDTLGVTPVRGRLLTPRDDEAGAPVTAVISHGLWQRAFGGDPGVLGRDVLLDGQKCTITGIMPLGFEFPPGEVDKPDLWTPLQIDPARPGGRASHYLYLLGRLKPGVHMQQARDEMKQLVAQSEATNGGRGHRFSAANHPISMFAFQDEVVAGVRLAMLTLLGAVAFVLAIACVNVSNLLLARAEARQREIAIRKAMGAPLSRLLRQFITEGALLSLSGAALGLLLAYFGLRLITATNAGSIPRVSEVGVNWTILLFTLAVSFATGIAFGLAPLAQIAAGNLHGTLKSASLRTTASAGENRFRRALVTAELALALTLLIGAGLMIRAFWKLQEVNIGLNAQNVLTMRLALPQTAYPQNERVVQFWTAVQQRVSALPGVVSASFMSGLPPSRRVNANDTDIEGFVPREGGPIQNIDYYQIVGQRYFETMGVPLIEGRYFDRRDGQGAPGTAIVNQTLARTFWPGQSAIGHRMRSSGAKDWQMVVGVVADVKNAGLDKPTGTELYLPYLQVPTFGSRDAYLVLRTKGEPELLANPARREIHTLDAALPVASVRTMDDVILAAQSRPRFLTLLLALFSGVALALAAVGLYGVISYSVAQRTGEFGIRMAMGAQTGDVLKMVLSQGMRLVFAAALIGAAGALTLTRLMRGLLFGVSSFDPRTFVATVALLGLVALAACFVPARRATKVDPVVALRYE